MSDDRMFERSAQAWLELGPSTAPKRVVDAALRTIATTPQQRDLQAPWRFPRLTIQMRFAVAAAVGLMVLGAGLLVLRSPQNQIGQTPTPSPSASPITMERLQGAWASVGTRIDPILGNAPDKSGLQTIAVDAASLRLNGWKGEIASSASVIGAAGQLELLMDAPQESLNREHWDCTTGDSGTYYASLSPDDQTLTLTSASDECASRDEILTGDWTRWSCPDPARYAYCSHVSELAPGRYTAANFKPFEGGTRGQFAYTVPAGWADFHFPPTWPGPDRRADLTLATVANPDSPLINVDSTIRASTMSAVIGAPPLACPDPVTASGGPAASVADWLGSRPFLAVSQRRPITIGGLSGVQIDVSVVAGFVDPCTLGSAPGAPIEYSTQIEIFGGSETGDSVTMDTATDDHARFIVLDTGDWQGYPGTLLISLTAQGQSALDVVIAQAMPVVQTFEFIPGPSASPTAVSSPIAVNATDLQGTWNSVGTRPIPDALDQLTVFTLGANYLDIHQSDGDVRSSWVLIEDTINRVWVHGPLTTVPVAPRWDCFGIGEYDVSLSTDGATLTFTPIDEDCAQREAILAGDWTRDVAAEPSLK
jgi:hypothetical protein